MRLATLACAVLALVLPCAADERVDLTTVHRIKAEALSGSQVMDHLFYLTDVNGPRLTASPGFESAARWAVKRLEGFGIAARVEAWGRFGRGWTLKRFSAHMREPVYAPLPGVPRAWCLGTGGSVTGEVVAAPILTPQEA